MLSSFAQFRQSLCALACAILLSMAATSPVLAQDAGATAVAAAQQAVNRADQADADQYAPDLLNAARSGLERAQAAAANRSERRQVPGLAARAAADADLARARSNEATASARLQQNRAEISELELRLGQEPGP